MGRDGVEPPEPKAADLQSAPLPLTVYLPILATLIRLELTTSCVTGRCSDHLNYRAVLVGEDGTRTRISLSKPIYLQYISEVSVTYCIAYEVYENNDNGY